MLLHVVLSINSFQSSENDSSMLFFLLGFSKINSKIRLQENGFLREVWRYHSMNKTKIAKFRDHL